MSGIALTKAQRRQVEAAAEVLDRWGLAWSIAKDGPHLHLKVTGPAVRGRPAGVWRLTVAGTPRDPDQAVKLSRIHARQLVDQINQRLGRL